MRRGATAVAALGVALAIVGSAGGSSASARAKAGFTFGRSGGNIAPYTVTIARDGRVRAAGAVQLARPDATVSAETSNGLLALARGEGFFAIRRRCDVEARCPTSRASSSRSRDRAARGRSACTATAAPASRSCSPS